MGLFDKFVATLIAFESLLFGVLVHGVTRQFSNTYKFVRAKLTLVGFNAYEKKMSKLLHIVTRGKSLLEANHSKDCGLPLSFPTDSHP